MAHPSWTSESEPIHVVEYTDPHSVWCWGCEPVIRRLEYLYPGRVSVDVRMGGLFEDFGPMREYFTRMSGGRWKDSVLAFLSAVAKQHRMPSNAERMMEGLDDFQSTWPACIAVKAAEFQGKDRGNVYLRHLRQASIVEGRRIHQRPVQVDVAGEAGLDVPRFSGALDDGSAAKAFHQDLHECRRLEIAGFPTFTLRKGLVISRVEGYQTWDAFDRALRQLDPDLRPLTPEANAKNLAQVLRRFGRCASREVAAVLSVDDDEAEILLEEVEADGGIVRLQIGDAVFWDLPTNVVATGAIRPRTDAVASDTIGSP
jgi:predicted DsbA family dithiol-disulfide isomerase